MNSTPDAAPESDATADANKTGARRLWLDQLAQNSGSVRELVLVDTDFSNWPLSDAEVLQALTGWVQRQRRLVLLAADFSAVSRQHPRWLAWRRPWLHQVSCWQADERDAAGLSATVLAAPSWALVAPANRFQTLRLTTDPRRVQATSERVRESLAHASVALSVTTLGL